MKTMDNINNYKERQDKPRPTEVCRVRGEGPTLTTSDEPTNHTSKQLKAITFKPAILSYSNYDIQNQHGRLSWNRCMNVNKTNWTKAPSVVKLTS